MLSKLFTGTYVIILMMEEIVITQTKKWQKLQEALGEKSIFISNDNYQFLAILMKTPVGNYLYLPYGPAFKDENSFKEAYEELQRIARDNDAFFIRVEPLDEKFPNYAPKCAKKSKDLNPKETWLLDLGGSDEDLKSKLPSRLLRYYKSAEKKGVKIEKSNNPDNIKYLVNLQSELAKEKNINTFSEKYLKTELEQPFSTLYLVKYQNEEKDEEVVAAGLVFDDETTRYNLQGAQSDTGRKLHATGILTIQLIYDAKDNGQKLFDFWGIAPEGAGPEHPWAGFTNFKKTFSGYQKNRAGTYDLVQNPSKYRLYKLARKINRLKRRH